MPRSGPAPGAAARAGAWAGRLVLAPGVFVYVGPGAAASPHAHNAVQLVWSAAPMEVQVAATTSRVEAALIPAGTRHAFRAGARDLALMLVERHDRRGAALDRRARELGGADISAALAHVAFPSRGLSPGELVGWTEGVLAALGVDVPPREPLSRAVRRALAFIGAGLEGRPRLDEAARAAAISPTRLTHRFTREVGMPFRRFVLWARLARAVEATRRGANLSQAAAAAGFADSAHLTRTFRATFGLSPSQLLPVVEIVGDARAR
ncbi:MAG: helix-turn-helix domain-containing protein [Kofleriaceae bacterium]